LLALVSSAAMRPPDVRMTSGFCASRHRWHPDQSRTVARVPVAPFAFLPQSDLSFLFSKKLFWRAQLWAFVSLGFDEVAAQTGCQVADYTRLDVKSPLHARRLHPEHGKHNILTARRYSLCTRQRPCGSRRIPLLGLSMYTNL